MSDYWKVLYDSISKKFDGSLLKQVGKTINGQEISENQIRIIVDAIAKALSLNSKDSIIDLCCGNGLITKELELLANEIVGIDFTDGLILAAKKYKSSPNIKDINSDVLGFDLSHLSGIKKILMYEALQHFSPSQLGTLLGKLEILAPGALIFIGSIPDKDKLRAYYDTEEKFAFYIQRESEGAPHIGKWWSMAEIDQIASAYGFKALFLPQESTLYTAYYRFDVLLEKM